MSLHINQIFPNEAVFTYSVIMNSAALLVRQNVQLTGFNNRKCSLIHAQFTVDIFDVKKNCIEADEKLFSNLFVFLPGGDEGHYFQLTFTERTD